MKETLSLRVNYDFAHLLFKADEGENLGTSVRVIEISKDDYRYNQIPIVSKQVKKKYDRSFYFSWEIKRKYSNCEINEAALFRLKILNAFEPTGEECGTIYDESLACKICGANRKQIGALKLKKSSIPKKDIARTIAGEVVVSEKFAMAIKKRGLKGVLLEPIILTKGTSDYYQLIVTSELELTENTVVGDDPFETTMGSEGGIYNISGYEIKLDNEIYICPKGHTIGLNLLSEASVLDTPLINNSDIFLSKQKVGVKRGLLRPEPIYFCSQAFRKMVVEEKLTGFDFEIAHIE